LFTYLLKKNKNPQSLEAKGAFYIVIIVTHITVYTNNPLALANEQQVE
jgi:hypothetical protein